ncbi:MAG: ferredoxin--NADP reductase [Flavobacterium sp.]
MKNYTLKVQEIKKETEDTVTLCFKQPGLKKIKYLPGQYLTLQFRINGRKYIRPYSFSSTPLIDSTLDVTIKRVPGGIVSNYINDNVKVDDVIEVQEPLGDFVFESDTELKSVVFWGVGSGITPLYSMIKQLLFQQHQVAMNLYLIYGNKSNSSVIFRNQLEKLKETYSERFKIYNFYSKEEFFNEDSHNYKGRIHSNFVGNLVKTIEYPTRHYICGPVTLKNTIKESLLANGGGDISNIFSEDFELVKNPKDFEDIITHNVNIHFQGIDTLVEVKKGNSILEAALDAYIELPYSCQTGSCNTCKGKLIKGELRMIGLSKERDDLDQGDYLLCCSYPLTDSVCIQI